jgi:peroxiredoxin
MKMQHRPTIALATIALSVALAACGAAPPPTTDATDTGSGADTADPGTDDSGEPTPPAGGAAVTDFVLKDVDGKSVALSDYLGKHVILISFWATWCEPCKKEMVQLQELYEAHADAGLMILSISMDEPESVGDVRPYVKQRRYTYPVLLDTEAQVTNQLNPRRAAPFSLLIGRNQEIVWEHEGYVPGDEQKIDAAVLEALGQTAP